MSSIQISNAEPIDTIVDGASALASEDTFYSIPTSTIENDNALTEYTLVKEVKIEARSKNSSENQISRPQSSILATRNNPDLEIYSTTSTLSLGETEILSDGWIKRPASVAPSIASVAPSISNSTLTRTNQGSRNQENDDSDFVLTLDIDTTASVI